MKTALFANALLKIFFSLCNFRYNSHISKNIRILLLSSISNSQNSDLTVARENILLVEHQETNGDVWLEEGVCAG